MAKSDDLRIAFVEEVTVGTPPATPAMEVCRIISDSLVEETESENSAELSGTPGITAQIDGGRTVSGDIVGYLVYNNFFNRALESVFGDSWTADQLIPGFDVETVTYEKSVSFAGTYHHQRFLGLGFGTWSMDWQAQQAIRQTFGAIGGELVISDVDLIGATYNATSPSAENAFPMRTADMTVTWGGNFAGITTSNTCHLSGSLTLTRDPQVRRCLTVASASEYEHGKFTCQINLELLVTNQSWELFNNWANAEEGTLTLTFTDQNASPNNHTYTLTCPRVKVVSVQAPAPETGQDFLANVVLEVLEPTGSNAMTLDRATA